MVWGKEFYILHSKLIHPPCGVDLMDVVPGTVFTSIFDGKTYQVDSGELSFLKLVISCICNINIGSRTDLMCALENKIAKESNSSTDDMTPSKIGKRDLAEKVLYLAYILIAAFHRFML